MTDNHAGELYHYGRKGMKWGQNIFAKAKARKVSKQRAENLKKARAAKAEKQKEAEERAKKVAAGKISAKKMTDKELQDRINRLELEKKYNDALKETKNATRGKRFTEKFLDSTVDKVAENAGADIVAQSLKVFTAKGANAGLNKILKTAAEEYVYTNNKKK